MTGNTIQELTEFFKRFPGIGPRQARRFVYFLLQQDKLSIDRLLRLIGELPRLVNQCPDCQRFFQTNDKIEQKTCNICRDQNRHNGQILIVEKDADLDSIEKAGGYLGQYFVLGGLVPILDKEPDKRVRLSLLQTRLDHLQQTQKLNEIIIALAATVEADHTADYLKTKLAPLVTNTKITILGRGLSGGLEIEYSDPETLKSALSNRHLL